MRLNLIGSCVVAIATSRHLFYTATSEPPLSNLHICVENRSLTMSRTTFSEPPRMSSPRKPLLNKNRWSATCFWSLLIDCHCRHPKNTRTNKLQPGFAKSRPAAQRPATAQQPECPQPTTALRPNGQVLTFHNLLVQ